MVKKYFGGDTQLPKEANLEGEVVFERYQKENSLAEEAEEAFRIQGRNRGDEVTFVKGGIKREGVISSVFYTKPNKDLPGSVEYYMTILVKDPDSKSAQVQKQEVSLDDVISDKYKIERMGGQDIS